MTQQTEQKGPIWLTQKAFDELTAELEIALDAEILVHGAGVAQAESEGPRFATCHPLTSAATTGLPLPPRPSRPNGRA